MKELNLKGSVLPNSNKIISESKTDWSGIRPGTVIKFYDEDVTYQVAKTESFFYIKDFKTLSGNAILVEDNTSVNLSKGDTLVLSYKEQELQTVFSILNGGRNYRVDDIVFVEGGVASSSIEDGTLHKTQLRVAEVLPGGIITKLAIASKGKYIESPANKCGIKGGNGAGGIIEVNYKPLEARAMIERDIVAIEADDNTKIYLSYPIPNAIKEGKLSTNKSALVLTGNYVGKHRNAELFDIARDFTSNYKWPLIMPNSFSMHAILNQIFHAQDKKIKELENRIIELEKTNA